jgi:hypothetical protein
MHSWFPVFHIFIVESALRHLHQSTCCGGRVTKVARYWTARKASCTNAPISVVFPLLFFPQIIGQMLSGVSRNLILRKFTNVTVCFSFGYKYTITVYFWAYIYVLFLRNRKRQQVNIHPRKNVSNESCRGKWYTLMPDILSILTFTVARQPKGSGFATDINAVCSFPNVLDSFPFGC